MQASERRELSPSRVKTILVFLVLLLMLVLSRLPFLTNTLLGEEGMFAALVLDPTPSSAATPNGLPQQLVAQIDGHRVYAGFQHPIIPYIVMERGIGVAGRAAHAFEGDFAYRNMTARGCYFALFAVGMLGLLWLAATALAQTRAGSPKFVIPAFVVYVLTTPLLLGASIQPQVDGSVGVMLMGLAAFAVVAGQGRSLEKPAFWLAGILIGLGRIEWVMAFVAAALAVVTAQFIFRERAQRLQPVLFLAGLAVGSALSYLASPADYLAGINVMSRISAASAGSLEAARQQRPLLTPVLLAAVVAVAFCGFRLRALLAGASGTLILTVGGIGVIAGFAASNWSGDGFPRYYAPALVALGFAVIDLATRANWSSPGRLAALLLILVGLWPHARFARDRLTQDASITTYPGVRLAPLREQMAANAKRAGKGGAIVLENSSIWIYYPEASFVGRELSVEGARELLATQFPNDVDRLVVP